MKTFTNLIVGIIIGLLSGVGIFQIGIAGTVSAHSVAIDKLQKDFDKEQTRTDQRIFKLVEMFESSNSLVRSSIEQTDKLINTIQVQNRIILEQNTTIDHLRNK